jgi:hypothetical protein
MALLCSSFTKIGCFRYVIYQDGIHPKLRDPLLASRIAAASTVSNAERRPSPSQKTKSDQSKGDTPASIYVT